MTRFLTPRVARVAAGLAVVSAFAGAPMGAQTDTTTATGTVGAGALSEVAPAIAPFTAGTRQGHRNFSADSGSARALAIVVPGDAVAGSFRSILTFTAAAPAA